MITLDTNSWLSRCSTTRWSSAGLSRELVVSIGLFAVFLFHCSFTIVLINIYIYGLTCLELWKGGANMLRAISIPEKYKTTKYDVSQMRRYNRNIFQWNKNDIKSKKMTNGDYFSPTKVEACKSFLFKGKFGGKSQLSCQM